jgi:hypothetical protein
MVSLEKVAGLLPVVPWIAHVCEIAVSVVGAPVAEKNGADRSLPLKDYDLMLNWVNDAVFVASEVPNVTPIAKPRTAP